jgi:Tfp pilus assembly protein PilO
VSSRRERIVLVVAVIVIGAYGLDALVLSPIVDKTTELRRQQEHMEARLLANLNTLRKRQGLARAWRSWLAGGLSRDPSEAESRVLGAVRSWVRDAGITLVSIQPDRPYQKGEVREIRFQASAVGAYESLIRFVYLVETAELPVRIQRFEVRPLKGTRSDQMVLELRFSTVYVTGPPAGARRDPEGGS